MVNIIFKVKLDQYGYRLARRLQKLSYDFGSWITQKAKFWVWGRCVCDIFKGQKVTPKSRFNPRPTGGGLFGALLSFFRDNSRNNRRIVTKLSGPYLTSILHIISKMCDLTYDRSPANDVNVTSCSPDLGGKNGFTASAVTQF